MFDKPLFMKPNYWNGFKLQGKDHSQSQLWEITGVLKRKFHLMREGATRCPSHRSARGLVSVHVFI